jgi:hypothetical protein
MDVELLLILSERTSGKAEARYACDDGESFAYQRGERSSYALEAEVLGGILHLMIKAEREGFGRARFTPVTVAKFKGLRLEGPDGAIRDLRAKAFKSDAWGTSATFYSWS